MKFPISSKKALYLAPMEDITDIGYRLLCREMGADVVYTEFVNSDGLIRNCKRAAQKLLLDPKERPVGIQIYGHDIHSMVEATKRVNEENPDILDINAGCWVKKVSRRGAGAGLMKDPEYLQKMIKAVVNISNHPVTVKTRLGWDESSINILEVAKRIEDAGAVALTIHCRTRSQGLSGKADWNWISKIKEVIHIPVILNGGIMNASDALEAFEKTNCDGIMIARGAIGQPWIFQEIKEILAHGKLLTPITLEHKANICLRHLKKQMGLRGDKRGIYSFRKYYSGYFKGFDKASLLRKDLVLMDHFLEISDRIKDFIESIKRSSI